MATSNGKSANIFAEPPGVSLSFPGPWPDRTALVTAIAEASGGSVLAAGAAIHDTVGDWSALFEVFDPDPWLAKAMAKGSGGAFDEQEMASLSAHRLVAGITISDFGNDLAGRIRRFSHIIEVAGGLGVMVDKSGAAHPFSRWNSLLEHGGLANLYFALMVHVEDRSLLTSFGMKQFGLADAAIGDPQEVDGDLADLIFRFNAYRIAETPTLSDGQTFSVEEGAPRYRLRLQEDGRYPQDHFYYNPHGVWRLDPLES
ncbi:MAG: hypothetical protein GC150_02005 [Rhizobiales bacterium]|nr:hypothetical protein [Hyphomicrobiales bacterium]